MAFENDKKDWSLVGYLATACSCRDPSDLRRVNMQMLVHHELEKIPPEHYSVEAWYTATRYILGVYLNGSPAEIKQKTLDILSHWFSLADAPPDLSVVIS